MSDVSNLGAKNIVNFFVDRTRGVTSTPKEVENLIGSYSGSHVKYFDSIIPSYKHDNSCSSSKPKNYVFHNDNKLEGSEMMHLSRGSFDGICIIRYHTNGFELLNEKQLRSILKNSGSLKDIDFIQTYIKPMEG